jgi:dethiobiotin synthetase
VEHRYFVTGTDTDVGKTRVAATLARALVDAGGNPTIVKLVQTGLAPGEEGDASRAARLAAPLSATKFPTPAVPCLELARFAKPADPWSAAIAEDVPPLLAADLAAAVEAISGTVVVEGSGGLAVPLSETEQFVHVAAMANLKVILTVGLRLGCINHALLSLALCEQMNLRVAAAILVERWGPTDAGYRADVERSLRSRIDVVGLLPFTPDERISVEHGARSFEKLVRRDYASAPRQGIRE